MKSKVQHIIDELLITYPRLQPQHDAIVMAFDLLVHCYQNSGKVLTCGNGGSAADAEHIVGELMKEFRLKRPIPREDVEAFEAAGFENAKDLCQGLQCALPAISLVSQVSLITAFGNDVNADMVFAQQVYGYGHHGDVLIALSTSGNSKNIVNAARVAKVKGLFIIGFTGSRNNALMKLCDATIRAPSDETFCVQEFHLPVYHALCAMVEEEIFG
jgi:D-sedoheptulose 7-phosphate isomerase